MDDTNDSRYSRLAQFEDLLNLCKWLNEEGVSYVVIGGFAVILQGIVRTTGDVDLLVDTSLENIRRLKKAMSKLPDNAVSLMEDDELQTLDVVRVADEFVVDLMARACGIDFARIREAIEWKEVEGIRIPTVGKEVLIKTKDTIRLKDKVDVLYLQERIEMEKKEAEKKNKS